MEVAHNPPTRLVGRGDDPSARRGELRRAFRVGYCCCDQFAELLEAPLGPRGQLFVIRDADHAPQTPLDEDRTRNRRGDAETTPDRGERTPDYRPIHLVDARRMAGAEDLA